ncbi:MAG: hypothetical protein AMXMBFR13_30990 [Phycisphaerae bacterium]
MPNSILGDFRALEVRTGSKSEQPFFRGRLRCADARELAKRLASLAQPGSRQRYYLTAKEPDTTRIKLVNLERTPEYERSAAQNYLRGDVFVVSGSRQSCNLEFSAVGAGLLAAELKAATDRCREWVEIVVPNRRRKLNLVEFIADTDLEAAAEEESLAIAGELALAEILPREDFSDWEQPE